MIESLKREAATGGDQLQVLSIQRLGSVRVELDAFKEKEDLNGFQKWIVEGMYDLRLPEAPFPVRSILLLAIPHPSYAKVEFTKKGKKHVFQSLVMSDFQRSEERLTELVTARGYRLMKTPTLPLKRLAVQSGLAVYGKNNITYVEGMGSFFSLAAFYSDLPCEADGWAAARVADRCADCAICQRICPTGAIRGDRFLIDNERCLSFLNERSDDFPEWLPRSVHHCLYDCLRCQMGCPMNRAHVDNVAPPLAFDEEETELLLAGAPRASYPAAMERKSKLLGLDQWPDGIPRNLRVLFELSDSR
jgi:epoxyqueuosine reductase